MTHPTLFRQRQARRADLPSWLLKPGKLASALTMLIIAAFGLGQVAVLSAL
ncbi:MULTISPECIES: hypothetical protein [Niveibacterium]|uniref:Uncharacterized protein n=1 Tax=Niveibacterium microcysteis TaxID=2811415 RepID=A0ABX7M517_9RHOO|nr:MULTISPECIES: hypothetical protein [Niveibacterium]QSI76514.1 hypothetical protein JY500_18960 [Niveibacterium microcysteis]